MAIRELIETLKSDKKALTAVTVLGAAGLCFIMLSSLLPDEKQKERKNTETQTIVSDCESYCSATEQRLTEFLKNIEGVGEVEVFLSVSGQEEYIYARENRTSVSENKTEEEESYVIIGGNGEKTALIETVKAPEISGAVIACTGSESPAVQEKVYEAVSTALDIPTSRVYVTKLR